LFHTTEGNQVVLKQKISYKVTALLALPLLLQVILLAILYGLTGSSDQLIDEEKTLTKTVADSGQEILLLNDCMARFGDFMMSKKSTNDSPTGTANMKTAYAEYQKLRDLAESDPVISQQLRPFIGHVEDEMMQARALGPIVRNGEGSLDVFKAKIEHMKVFMTESKEISRLATNRIVEGLAQLERDRQKFESDRRKKMLIVVLVFVAEILIVAGLACLFVKGLTGRLNILVDNAFRLPRGMELEKEVKGSDELTFLDKALHEAGEYLKEASEQRTMIMEMIAHDMRTPLMSAQIASEMVANVAQNAPEAVRRHLTTIQRNLGVVINLVNDLLTIDRLESGALELRKAKVEMKALVEDALQGAEALAIAKEITLQNDSEPDVHAVVDRDRIIQVVTNLITNAIKFSPKGSTIKVAVADQQRFVQVSVSDQGPGLPPGSEKKIFEKFHQVDKDHDKKGYGLGLTICKMLVELHGGTISAQSLPQKGSRFFFSVPRVKG